LTRARGALGSSDVFGDIESGADLKQIADNVTGQYWLMTAPRIRLALEVALATGRPLLIEGDPGTGKSTLARAVARTLKWRYLEVTITSRTQAQDLLWSMDYLRRMKDAQLGGTSAKNVDDERNYLMPGILWWALDPRSASTLPSRPLNPCPEPADSPAVLLIDEIDKADPEVPDNLLAPLGTLGFPIGWGINAVTVRDDTVPLVIITSNRERDLSPPFLRRCVKLYLETPPGDILMRIALGHLGSDSKAVEAVATTYEVLLGGDAPSEPASMSTAAFIDAARAALELGLHKSHEAWGELRILLEGQGIGRSS